MSHFAREGFLDVPGGRAWYGIAGDGGGIPLLVLHGGPGAGYDYLESLAALSDERPVVFYDQLGCGKSDIPDDLSLWEVGRFVREVDAVRAGLDLGRVHLLGQSWGGFLAIEYMVGAPADIVSLTLASTAASAAAFAREARRLVAGLPADMRAAIERCEAEGTTDSPEYQEATQAFYRAHLCRLPEWPEEMLRTVANVAGSPTYGHMWGPSEFSVTGNLSSWDRSADLGRITVPTLITAGRYDEATPALAEELAAGIGDSEVRIFEDAAHMAHREKREEYNQTLRAFLRRAESR